MNHEAIIQRNEKELATIKRKLEAAVKKLTCNTGEVRWSSTGGQHYVEIDNDGKVADDLADIVRKSPTAVLQDAKEYAGTYMWDANVYIRPCSVIVFTF